MWHVSRSSARSRSSRPDGARRCSLALEASYATRSEHRRGLPEPPVTADQPAPERLERTHPEVRAPKTRKDQLEEPQHNGEQEERNVPDPCEEGESLPSEDEHP